MLSFRTKHCGWVARLALGMILMLGLCACDGDDWKHTPPAGMGSIIVDNRTADGVNVYLDGYYTNRVSDFDNEAFDLAPAIHRVVLDEAIEIARRYGSEESSRFVNGVLDHAARALRPGEV